MMWVAVEAGEYFGRMAKQSSSPGLSFLYSPPAQRRQFGQT